MARSRPVGLLAAVPGQPRNSADSTPGAVVGVGARP